MRICPLLLALCLVLRAQDPPEVLEAALQADPHNQTLRLHLMEAYEKSDDSAAYLRQVLWLVENSPESELLARRSALAPKGDDYQQVKAAWEAQLSAHADSAMVLSNAAVFLSSEEPARAIELLEQARHLAAGNADFVDAEAVPYRMALVRNGDGDPAPPLSREAADEMRTRLMASTDAQLLGAVGKLLRAEGGSADLQKLGLELLERAVSADPLDPKIRAALNTASMASKSARREPYRVPMDAQVAEGRLKEKVEPEYPILAISGRVQGAVELTAFIDEDGSVDSVKLVSGPAMLVSAAKDAVLQWQYDPLVINGKAVGFVTNVVVNFSLAK
jgi:protein TonB